MSATSERLALTAREVGVLRPGESIVFDTWTSTPPSWSPRRGWWLVEARNDAWTWLGRNENAAHEALRRLARDKEAR